MLIETLFQPYPYQSSCFISHCAVNFCLGKPDGSLRSVLNAPWNHVSSSLADIPTLYSQHLSCISESSVGFILIV